MSDISVCMGGCCVANPYPIGHCCQPENGCCVINTYEPFKEAIPSFSFYVNPASLVSSELLVLQNLKDAWNNFIQLDPKMDTDFTREFNDSIHRCQQIIALRVAQRVDPLVW